MKNKQFKNVLLPRFLTLLSSIYLSVRSFHYANILPARLDESLFLYKGYLFASGVYKPFEPYGLWTNKNPFSFLIPGWFELIFGAGLRTGRILSVFLGLLTVLAVWIIVKKFTNEWFALFAVTAIALNPFYAWNFSQFMSQSLTAVLVAWMLVFTLGKGKPIWQIIAGTLLAVLLVQVRQNMLPIIPFLIIYIYWGNGKKVGNISLIVGLISFIGITVLYWPEIIRNYFAVIPNFMINLVKNIAYIPDAQLTYTNNFDSVERVLAFTEGIRIHYIEVLGAFFASIWILIPSSKRKVQYQTISFLLILFAILFFAHMWASVFNNYCVFCFSNYLTFFGIIGIVLLTVCLYKFMGKPSPFWILFSILFLLLLCTCIGFSIFQNTGHFLMELEVPRVKNLTLESGTTELWTMLSNKFDLTYDELEIMIPTIFGFLGGLFFLGISAIIQRFQKKGFSFLVTVTITFAVLGSVVTFPLNEQQYGIPLKNCSNDSIANYEAIGEYLNSKIEPNSKVWWWGLSGQIALSYVDDIQIYPPQLNHMFNYMDGGTSDDLYKHGYWNEELALEWLSEANYAIVENTTFSGDIVKWIDAEQFEELPHTISINQCSAMDYFRIFRRK